MAPRSSAAGRWPSLLREPLLHFFVLGGLLFALHSWSTKKDDPEHTLIVTSRVRTELGKRFAQRSGREPSPTEMSGLIEQWARDEALFREAQRLGLDQNDPVVKDRVIQKMRGVEEGLAVVRQPTDAELSSWLAARRKEYESPLRIDLEQVFVNQDRPDAEARADAVVRARAAGAESPAGDPFPMGARFENRSSAYLRRSFGDGFANRVARAKPGEWQKAESKHGWHAFVVTARHGGEKPTLEALRATLVRDWTHAERQRLVDEKLTELARRYRVVEAP